MLIDDVGFVQIYTLHYGLLCSNLFGLQSASLWYLIRCIYFGCGGEGEVVGEIV